MKKRRFARHIPLVLALSGMGVAIKSAVDDRAILNRVLDNSENMLNVPPELLRDVSEKGKILVYWVDGDGNNLFKTIDEDGS